ncbi:MAG TPA: flagellar motor switch protein FliG [Thermomicrobiales bacterium]|nr:flagellar motor switch protein FliG [Thermomicrobiales bacterium]
MSASRAQQLRGRQKAAALFIGLGPEISAEVMKHMRPEEVEAITREIMRMEQIDDHTKEDVFRELYDMALAHSFISTGGSEYAREMLVRAFGEEYAEEILRKVGMTIPAKPFEFLRKSDPRQLANFLQSEQPQTIALVLSHLPATQSAEVMSNFPDELQVDVAMRIATMDRTPPEVIQRVEEILQVRMSSVISQEYSSVGGTQYLVEVLSSVDRATEREILDRLEDEDAEIAEEVRKLMFTFEDIINLDSRSVQRVLREVQMKDLALALKGARDDLKEHIYSNMSQRAGEMLREEIEISGPARIRTIEDAQQRIVAIIRRLEEQEEIIISRGGEVLV